MFPKINVFKIVSLHLKTLKSCVTNKPSLKDWLTFFVLPVSLSSSFVYYDVPLSKESISLFITILSILGGFSFNLLAIIFGYHDKIERSIKNENSIKWTYIKEIHSNISFSILNSFLCIAFLLLCKLDFKWANVTVDVLSRIYNLNYAVIIVNFSTFFLIIFYVITLLMILKRISILFNREMSK